MVCSEVVVMVSSIVNSRLVLVQEIVKLESKSATSHAI